MNLNKSKYHKMNLFYISMIIISFLSCNAKIVEYKISDSYVGPCVVFVYSKDKILGNSDVVTINEGLGRIYESKMKQKFLFRSIEKGIEISIIPIGEESQTSDTSRCIFMLTKGSSDSNCLKEPLNIVTFFIGKKQEFINWGNKYNDELDYFESIGVNWCEYYKKNLQK